LFGVGNLGIDEIVALLKDSRQRFDGLLAPGTQHVWMHLVLSRQLADRLGFLEQLQYELRFERGGVNFFPAIILPNSDHFVVLIILSPRVAYSIVREQGKGEYKGQKGFVAPVRQRSLSATYAFTLPSLSILCGMRI
jgi:hypothetical protein